MLETKIIAFCVNLRFDFSSLPLFIPSFPFLSFPFPSPPFPFFPFFPFPISFPSFQETDKLGSEPCAFGEEYDIVTCMFAIHYFFENETIALTFLSNVADNLKVSDLNTIQNLAPFSLLFPFIFSCRMEGTFWAVFLRERGY